MQEAVEQVDGGMSGAGVSVVRGLPKTGQRLPEFFEGQRPVPDPMLQTAEALRGNAPGVHHPQNPLELSHRVPRRPEDLVGEPGGTCLEPVDLFVGPRQELGLVPAEAVEVTPCERCPPRYGHVPEHPLQQDALAVPGAEGLAEVEGAAGFGRAEPRQLAGQRLRRSEHLSRQRGNGLLPGVAVTLELLMPGVLSDQADEPAVEILGDQGVIPLPDLAFQVDPGDSRQGADLGLGPRHPIPVLIARSIRTMQGSR